MAPNADDPDLIDSVTVAGWLDFRRLRPDAAWHAFHRRSTLPASAHAVEPIDAAQAPGGAMPIPEFCANAPALKTCSEGDFTHCEIGPSATGAAGVFSQFSGFLQRAHGVRWADADDDIAEFGAPVLAPVERPSLDLLMHRSLPMLDQVTMELSSAAFNDAVHRTPYLRMPIEAVREDLGSPPAMASAQVPRLQELVDTMFQRGGWRAEDFRGLRFEVAYPRFPAVAVPRCPLQKRPDSRG